MPDLIWHPGVVWIPAFAGMTNIRVFCCRFNRTRKIEKYWRDEGLKSPMIPRPMVETLEKLILF